MISKNIITDVFFINNTWPIDLLKVFFSLPPF